MLEMTKEERILQQKEDERLRDKEAEEYFWRECFFSAISEGEPLTATLADKCAEVADRAVYQFKKRYL